MTMMHFHPLPNRSRLTITLGATVRWLPRFAYSRRSEVGCGFFYVSWLGVYVEYNHITRSWRKQRYARWEATRKPWEPSYPL